MGLLIAEPTTLERRPWRKSLSTKSTDAHEGVLITDVRNRDPRSRVRRRCAPRRSRHTSTRRRSRPDVLALNSKADRSPGLGNLMGLSSLFPQRFLKKLIRPSLPILRGPELTSHIGTNALQLRDTTFDVRGRSQCGLGGAATSGSTPSESAAVRRRRLSSTGAATFIPYAGW